MDAHTILLAARDFGGLTVAIGLIYQIGKLVNQLERVTEAMVGHIATDETRFREHSVRLDGHGERLAHLEGRSDR